MPLVITPRTFHPRVELLTDGRLRAPRTAVAAPGDDFASGLEFAAIAADDLGRPLLAGARAPLAHQRRLVTRIERWLATNRLRGQRRLRAQSAAATVLLDVFEGARGRTGASRALARAALAAYLALLDATRSTRLRESMTVNLDRVHRLLDADGKAALAEARRTILPVAPPYDAWFPGDSGELRIVCQVQSVYFKPWQRRMRGLGFRAKGRATASRIRYVREDEVGGRTTRYVIDYVEKAEGIFTAMADPAVHVVAFLGHSDWWARVPRNLATAPDQVGEKLLILIMCFGKHFYHSLHERFPKAHIVTTKDPTEDPEDRALLHHLFEGISARRGWPAIRRAVLSDEVTERNFIFPDDARYLAGVNDEDRDGRIDRFDRFCNVGAPRTLEAVGVENSFVPDPPGLHPRGAELSPRELDGGKVFEAALMLNSLSYDNYWLDQINRDQRVVAGGWHHTHPGDFAATRFTSGRRDRRDIVRLSCSTRYARAAQPAVTAMVVYEGWRWLAGLLPDDERPSPRDTSLMGILLVAHALANAHYDRPRDVFKSFLRRWGFPAFISYEAALATVESDHRWESGSPRAVKRFAATLPATTLARLERLVDGPRVA